MSPKVFIQSIGIINYSIPNLEKGNTIEFPFAQTTYYYQIKDTKIPVSCFFSVFPQ